MTPRPTPSDLNECELWPGALTADGYGSRRINGRHSYAHREAYEAANGPIPDGLTIDHLCRNRACCNPAHLEAVTQAENVRRGNSRRDYVRGDVCIHGHDLDGLRSDSGSRGGVRRYCKTCSRERARLRRAA